MAVQTENKPSVGFVGIGMMGWPMAARLVGAGFPVTVYDTRAERTADFARDFGGQAAASLAEAARGKDFVVTILPDSRIVAEALFGENGFAPSLKPGATVIEMTSGVPGTTIALCERLGAQSVAMIDAPVSGGVSRARTGELAIMVGGEDAAVEACSAVLAPMGSALRTGGIGSGQAMKALNNLVSAGGFLIGVEALLIGKKFGLDPEMMVDVLNASTGMNNSSQKKYKQFVLSGAFNSGFSLDLMVKDLGIALEVARDGKASAPFAALCREMWASAASVLGPGKDHTALAQFSEKLAGEILQKDAGSPGSGGTR